MRVYEPSTLLGFTSSPRREKAVQRLQSGCLPERPRAAKALWILLSVPLLVATDILVTLRYLWQDPLEVEVFHFLKLRGLLEAVEAMLQTLLQSYVAFRLLNPGGFFAEVEAKQVKPTALCLSIVFSIKNLGEQFLGSLYPLICVLCFFGSGFPC